MVIKNALFIAVLLVSCLDNDHDGVGLRRLGVLNCRLRVQQFAT